MRNFTWLRTYVHYIVGVLCVGGYYIATFFYSTTPSFALLDIVQSPSIDTTFPTRANPNNTEDITDLAYWLDTLLYEEDKTAAGYVVYPKAGVTIPLVRPDEHDLEKIKAAELFDHYKYLEQGALHYVGNAPDQGIGNMVLAVHSSFAKKGPGRYKTAGQVAPVSKPGDKIFVYLADETGAYTLYIYQIHRSEQIPETAVDILDQNVTTKSLTLFTCYPIGTTDARRVNQAKLIETVSSDKRYAPVRLSFTTQSVTDKPLNIISKEQSKPVKQQHEAAPLELSGSMMSGETTISITPTFKERVSLRPVVYRTAMKLMSSIGFNRKNLQKLVDALDKKITTLSEQTVEAKRTTIVAFVLIKEIVLGFMK